MNLTALLNFESVKKKGALTQSEQLNEFVANSLRAVVEEFFLQMAPSFMIVVSCRRKAVLNFYLSVMQHLFHMVDNMIIQLVYVDNKNPQRIDGPRLHNLLLVDSLEAFLDIDIISYTKDYDTNEYYHIFLMQRDILMFHGMSAIFNYCWVNHIVNCNIQHQNFLGEIVMYTYFPFNESNCGNTSPQIINKFVANSWINRTYFHSKLGNLYGCPLVAAMRDIPPYSHVTRTDDVSLSYSGFEIDLMEHLAGRMNFTLNIRTKLLDDRIIPKRMGPLKMIIDGTADMVFGFYRKHYGVDYMYTTTFPHYQSNIITVLYLPAHKFNTFQVLAYPFPEYAWYALCLTVFLIIVLTRLMSKNKPQSISMFSIIACALGAPIQKEPRLPHSALIFITWLWFTFLIRTIYSGLLFNLFRNRIYTSLPLTLDQADADNFRAVMNIFTYNDIQSISLYQHAPNQSNIVLNSYDNFIPLSYIEKYTEENVYAVVSQEFLIYYSQEKKKPGLFYVIPEIMKKQQLCIYLAKHSYLTNQLNKELINLEAVGLFQFWANHYIDSQYLMSCHMHQDQRIEQDNLWGIYIICGLCYFIAFIIFLIELLSMKLKILKKLFE